VVWPLLSRYSSHGHMFFLFCRSAGLPVRRAGTSIETRRTGGWRSGQKRIPRKKLLIEPLNPRPSRIAISSKRGNNVSRSMNRSAGHRPGKFRSSFQRARRCSALPSRSSWVQCAKNLRGVLSLGVRAGVGLREDVRPRSAIHFNAKLPVAGERNPTQAGFLNLYFVEKL
jgi:hypothetical protein